MSKGRIVLIAAGLLIAAGALVLVVRGFSSSGSAPAAAAAGNPAGAASGGKAGEKEPPPKWQSFLRPGERAAPRRPVLRSAQNLPNPFDRLGGGPAIAVRRPENPGFRLEGISFGDRAVALISGRAVREGDVLSGFRVLRVGRAAVTLAGPGGRIDLKLGTPEAASAAPGGGR